MRAATKALLSEALKDEYEVRAFYRRVIEAFGPVRPFVNVLRAEEYHIRAVEGLFRRYGLPLPAEPKWTARRSVSSLLSACRAAAKAEIDNVAMYERLPARAEEPDVRRVFRRLQAASRNRHLPAFQRCVVRGGVPGGGAGGGRCWCGGRRSKKNKRGWRRDSPTRAAARCGGIALHP